MASPQNSLTVSAGTWQSVFTASGTDRPRGYCVANSPDSDELVEVFILPVHGTSAPGVSDEGISLWAGQRQAFYANLAGAAGEISAVYVRSTGAVISHGVAHA